MWPGPLRGTVVVASRAGTGPGVAADEGVPVGGRADMTVDVTIVGGGIAGAALATVLARDGYEVLLLERQTSYRDKVRGEILVCWGVAEMLALDLEKPLLDAGGHYVTRGVLYDEVIDPATAKEQAIPLDRLLPGVPGALDVGHPEACEALARTAADAGATVLRGVGDVEVVPGARPTLRYELDDLVTTVSAGLVVGADGRTSSIRRRLGLALRETRPTTMGGGMLVDGLDAWPADQASLGTEGDLYHLVFPRAHGRARLYLLHDVAQRGRFAGPDRQARFLDAFQFRCLPDAEVFRSGRPAGPCAFYPMNDTWTDVPCAPGVVLIGDAAGWNDPIIGQGLSIALRDVRMVADVVRAGPDRSVTAFTPYVQERQERMRRLRLAAKIQTALVATFTPSGAARRKAFYTVFRTDPVLGGPRLAAQLGPERVPAEAFGPENVARILAMG
jgi:2-polyprenyl-6-methoxyphenol hydroxylase-like FAD-dependent oxidoreductase